MNQRIVNRIKLGMALKGIWTYRELARQLGASQGYINNIMCGKSRSKKMMKRIATLLDIPESELLPAAEPKEPPTCQTPSSAPCPSAEMTAEPTAT